MILYCVVGAMIYVAVLWTIAYRLHHIEHHPQEYKEIRGWDRYKKSVWFEKKVNRYGPGYYASLILGIPFLFLFLTAYYYFCVFLHELFPILAGNEQDSSFFWIGMTACVFYQIGLLQYLVCYIHCPIFVACRMYMIYDDPWVYGGEYHLAWWKMFRWLFWCSLICLPFILAGLVF